ncbi:MAG TPA: HDOD domain-containing protein [Steroidobacteraceae bacterium]|nr:HDOD domain-containing protein [Steroidobacteraceae bacterium]
MQSTARVASTATEELERHLERLPLLPAVVSEVLSLDPDADDYFDRLVLLAEHDPPFAVRVLGCANSAFSAPTIPIVTLHQAVMRLGSQQCARLVLALAVVKVFVPNSIAQRFLWIHSLQTALFARMFCREFPVLRPSADRAYVCGLLHDIGRFVQLEEAPGDPRRVDGLHWASPAELVAIERGTLGHDHAMLGWHACRKWSLPASIGEVVRRHHEALPEQGPEAPDLVRIVQWADTLSMSLLSRENGLAHADDTELLQHLAAQCAGIGPARAPGPDQPWHHRVPGLLVESMQIARQLSLLP